MKINNNYNLFERDSIFKLKKIDKNSFLNDSDLIDLLRNRLSLQEGSYPDILNWYEIKVKPGLKSGERIAYLGFIDGVPIASAILKLGKNAKFCHLYIEPEYQNDSLGELFFCQMTLDAKRFAKEIHFTLPESLWIEKKEFFQSFGFQDFAKFQKQYRSYDTELRCSSQYNNVWMQVMHKIPKINSKIAKKDDVQNGILMSIRPEFAEKIKSGEKTIEIRKYFNTNLQGRKLTIYSSRPFQNLLGYADIDKVEKNSPEVTWNKYKDKIACSEKEFAEYTFDSKQIYSIFLKNFNNFTTPVPLNQLSFLVDTDLKPPQSYYKLENNQPWSNALSIIEFEHKRYNVQSRLG